MIECLKGPKMKIVKYPLVCMLGFGCVRELVKPKPTSYTYQWHLMVNGRMYSQLPYGQTITIDSLNCMMDQGTKTPKPPNKMRSRWLQCQSPENGFIFRIMSSCGKAQQESQRLILVSKKTGRLKKLINLVCNRHQIPAS